MSQKNKKVEKGVHIIANLFDCKNGEYLVDKKKLEKLLTNSIERNGLNVVHKYFHKFVPEGMDGNENEIYGMTGYMLLAESHVSVHTWPDRNNYVAMDIFVCNYSKDNRKNAKKIYQELLDNFKPARIEETFLRRN